MKKGLWVAIQKKDNHRKEVKNDTHIKIITAANNVSEQLLSNQVKQFTEPYLGVQKSNNFYRDCRSCEAIPRSNLEPYIAITMLKSKVKCNLCRPLYHIYRLRLRNSGDYIIPRFNTTTSGKRSLNYLV